MSELRACVGLCWRWAGPLLLIVLIAGTGPACSVRRIATTKLADALAQTGSTFARDDDPDLIRDAAPFSLKLMESVLAEVPEHKGLLTAAAAGFTQYAFAFVQQDADEIEDRDLESATRLRMRAKRLYLRARDYGLQAVEVERPGFSAALRADAKGAVQDLRAEDVPVLYWTAAAWGAAIGLSKDDPDVVAEVPLMEALIDRAFVLDPAYGQGALHSFFITYEMSRSGGAGDPEQRAREHFARAVALSKGQQAGPYVSLAEAVTIQRQKVKEFESLLGQALAVDPDANPDFRLVNLIMQERARWLLSQKEELFLIE